MTSHDVVATARRMLRQPRVGHTGTLDPFATGVLPLALGRATRLVRFMASDTKGYDATIVFGTVTDTYDITGKVTRQSDKRPNGDDLRRTLASMLGTHPQVPPAFSAKRVDGHRAYDLARQQRPVELAPVEVRLDEVELLDFDGTQATARLSCSAGFYVRSFAYDVGEHLGCGACLGALRRTRSGPFTLEDAVTVEAMAAGQAEARIRPLSSLLPDLDWVTLTALGRDRLRHGQIVRIIDTSGDGRGSGEQPTEWVRLLDADGTLAGIGQRGAPHASLHPSIVLI